ncbi:MAG TPA: type II secretion system F family protein [Verrucomicrobiae bacterium]|nr:type II secretion system F family protein [Verrucomicrobiae bacterium]
MTLTPGQLAKRANLYFQIGSLIAAGVPVIQALEMVEKSGPRSTRDRLRVVINHLQQGSTFSEAFRATGKWLPPFDLALFSAGEMSGRLDATLRSLGNYYQERSTMLRKILSGTAYPIFILHMAIFIFPTSYMTGLFLHGGVDAFVFQKLSILVPIYLVFFTIVIAFQGSRGAAWRALMERVTAMVPLLGSARHDLALSRLSAALEALLSAGVPIISAWQIAADASGSNRLKNTVSGSLPRMEAGVTPSEAVRQSSSFPELFQNLYASGEVSGQLDSTLLRLHNHYQEQATSKFENLANWTPKLIFLIVAIIIGYQVISFYSNYFNQINKMM